MPSKVEGKALSASEREGALWAKALDQLVAITPGSNYYHPHNGTFRLTFTLRRPALLEGLARLEKALGLEQWEETGWGIASEEAMLVQVSAPSALPKAASGPTVTAAAIEHLLADDMSYLDVASTREALKGRPCAC